MASLEKVMENGPAPGVTTPGERRRSLSAVLEPYLYLSPALILLALVMFVPLVIGLSYAFRNVHLLDPFARGWVGFDHFAKLADDPYFFIALWNTVVWTFGSLFFQFFLGLGLALLLNREFLGRKVV